MSKKGTVIAIFPGWVGIKLFCQNQECKGEIELEKTHEYLETPNADYVKCPLCYNMINIPVFKAKKGF